jgi:translation initiation factor 1 (eIF-1/SUI1)
MSTGKAFKTIAFTAVAQDHHNAIKIKNVLKWLRTGHEVRVAINGKSDRQKAMEAVLKELESKAKSGAKITQKVVKPDSIRFYMRPTAEAVNIVIDETQDDRSNDLDIVTQGKDIFSDDFVAELERSINEDKKKSRKK